MAYSSVFVSLLVFCSSNPIDDAGFFSFTTFTWMTPMMWNLFRNRLNVDSLSLSPHDGSDKNGERYASWLGVHYLKHEP